MSVPTQSRTQARARTTRVLAAARRQRRDSRGAVTAETVMVLPVLVAVALGLTWVLALAATQVRVVDAAREVARSAARDDSTSQSLALGRRVAPQGAVVSLAADGDTVVAQVRARVRGPGGLFGFLPGVVVGSEAVAAREQR